MVNVLFGVKFHKVVGTLAAIATVSFGAPAFANSSSSADIAAPLRAAQAARPSATTDEKFQALFSTWQTMEESTVPALAAVAEAAEQGGITATARARATTAAFMGGVVVRPMSTVSIPSRMPVEGYSLTSGFGMRTHPVLGGRRGHKGIDLAAATGTPIHATGDGVISMAEWYSSYGLYVAVEHGGALQTRYAHMSRLNVAPGQRVRKGDIIGFVGSTGRSTGPHLHYEVRVNGVAVNPVPYMQADSYMRGEAASGAKGG